MSTHQISQKSETAEYMRSTLQRLGVFMFGHFVYTSGRHGGVYVAKNLLYPHTTIVSDMCRMLAHNFRTDNIDVVIGPADGGIILSQWTAYHLSMIQDPLLKDILSVYAEKDKTIATGFSITRGYDRFVSQKRVLVVDDVLTTGGTVSKIVGLVRACGGTVVGVGVLCNRGRVTEARIGNVPKLVSLLDMQFTDYDPKNCPLCDDGVPIYTDLGKGRDFLESQRVS